MGTSSKMPRMISISPLDQDQRKVKRQVWGHDLQEEAGGNEMTDASDDEQSGEDSLADEIPELSSISSLAVFNAASLLDDSAGDLDRHAQAHSDSVADQIAPEEPEAQDQPAQGRVPDRVNPGGVI